MTGRSHVTTHVLDAAAGRPAEGVDVRLEARTDVGAAWAPIAAAVTDADGRVSELGPAELPEGVYRVVFDTAAYFGDRPTFYPEVSIVFEIAVASEHYHVPLLLSPFAYSTYRGS
ncbi:hydroxyisourate hydrolase [Agromyces sp. ISL-38]|uniref:hydroxyisourate hydrolase n=1 Tax=Agromyces sp. ISL-38 TaxID=2819107 RepID=UPI001BE792A7|nr:hydroxyisourate hydrolase [Agromyces sp. ISL-38]MBT2498134.1 hydroxyisourate hydrolase [Agromyces sp. ISL-38]MBT2518716.1 hydroxyisourate hydrolase [Streptomyces sp. ISL-90]